MTKSGEAVREIRVGEEYDTREALRNAARQVQDRGLDKFLIVDADAHHYELESWTEIVEYIEDAVIRAEGRVSHPTAANPFMGAGPGSDQHQSGRLIRYRMRRAEETGETGARRDVVLIQRAMESMGIDYQVNLPTSMLTLARHPVPAIEVEVSRAYARWFTERVAPANPRIRTLLYLPFSDPDASLRMVEEFGDARGVVGFMVTAFGYRSVWHNDYAPVYRAIEETGKPLSFHASFHWAGDRAMETLNRFLSVHAVGFVWFNLINLTNWVINGMPERFPNLKVIWIESGLAWLPFIMERLDHEFVMRPSEAPLLERKPSEYMRDMYYTTQPLDIHNQKMLELFIETIDGENSLLYASDYPHWDFDLPSTIFDLPFLSDEAKRKILGQNGAQLFGLPDPYAVPAAAGVAAD